MTNAIAVKPLIICALILIVSGFAGARAQTSNYWTGEGSDNSWTNPLNWSTNQVPGAEDSVIIDVPASLFYRIHIDGEHSVRDLTISSNRAVLAIEGSFSVLRNFTFSEGRIEGSGVLIVESDMDWINGDMYGDGTTILSGNTLFRAPGGWTGGNILDERTLEIRGHLRIDEGTLWPHNGAVVIVDNSATVEMTDGDTGIQPRYGNVVKPRLINRGVIAKTGGSSTRSTIGYNSGPSSDRRMVLENYGEIRNEAGNMSIYFAEESINEGTLIAEAGSIDLFHAGGLHADPIIVAGTLRGSAQFQLRYALHLAGDVDVSGVMIVRDGQEFTSDLTISRLGYLVIDTNQFTEYVFTYAASGEPVVGGLQVDGRLHLESDLTIGGHAGIGMRLPAEVTGDGNLTVLPGGNLRWGYGSAEGAGTIHVQGDFTSIPALLQIGDFPEQVSATHLIGSTLIFDGDVTWDDGNLVLDEGATVVINDNANFDVHRDGQFVQGEFAIGSERIINLGTFQKSGVGRRTSQGMDETTYDDVSYGTLIDVEFENSGTLSAQEGEIIIGGQFVQMGLIEGTSTLDFSNGNLQFLDGRIAPGPDIGTLTLVGNFELYDQLIEIDVSSDGNDMLIVEGNVALGGNLAVVGQDLEASPGDRFVIAEATGFLAGDFDEVFVENMGNLDASISIADNQVIVELTGEAGSPTLVVDRNEIHFADTAPGGSTNATVRIDNEGDGLLSVHSYMLEPEDAPFVWEEVIIDIEPGEHLEVDVRFVPEVAGEFEAALTISTNAGDAVIQLSGTAVDTHVPAPVLAVDVDEVSFEEIAAGGSSAASITISNEGDGQLVISGYSLEPEDAPFVWEGVLGDVEPGAGVTLDIAFAPVAAGTYEATLSVLTNAGDAAIQLQGTATEPPSRVPVAVDDHATTLSGESVAIDVLANDYDPEGQSLTIVEVTQPEHGTATTDGRIVSYNPVSGFIGTVRFAYTIENEAGAQAEARVTVAVVPYGYAITELTPGAPSRATSISPGGIVAGVTLTSSGVKPFIWRDRTLTVVETPPNVTVTPYSVDDDGTMAGVAVDDESITQAVIIRPDGKLTALGGLGGTFSAAFDRNSSGMIVGTASDVQDRFHAFRWQGDMNEITLESGRHAEAFAVNDRGYIAGVTTDASGENFAVANGVVVRTPESRAYSINNVGVSAGSALADGRVFAVIWDEGSDSQPLGSGDHNFAEAYSINDAGWIVGTAGRDDLTAPASKKSVADAGASAFEAVARWLSGPRASFEVRLGEPSAGKVTASASLSAALWSDGQIFNLNDLIHGDAGGWHLEEARAISAAGHIVGSGTKDGRTAAFLLTPVDEALPVARKYVKDVEGTDPVVIHAAELAESTVGDLVLLGFDGAVYGDIAVAESGDHLVYTPVVGFAARDAFDVFVSNGRGVAVSARVEINLVPDAMSAAGLLPNYPNPFSTSTTIRFALPEAGFARIALFDMLGREIRTLVDDDLSNGVHEIHLPADELASGTYLVRFSNNVAVDTRIINVIR